MTPQYLTIAQFIRRYSELYPGDPPPKRSGLLQLCKRAAEGNHTASERLPKVWHDQTDHMKGVWRIHEDCLVTYRKTTKGRKPKTD